MVKSRISLPSFAKINWSMRVLGKRADGYHEVETILQTISLHDDLHFELTTSEQITLSCNASEIPTDDRNHIVRSALALQRRHKVKDGVRIRLEKAIPTKAGLGGGSANAAVSLLALTHLWELDTNKAELFEIGAGLGVDVPFFLVGGCALGKGTGTTVSPLEDLPVQQLLVITPNVEISTSEAYSLLRSSALTTPKSKTILSSSREEVESRHSIPWPPHEYLANDFERVIFDMEPEIRRAKETLFQAGASSALLAGSGSSVFGIFFDREAQQRALREIQLEAGWRVFSCTTLSRDEYFRAVDPVALLRSFNLRLDTGA